MLQVIREKIGLLDRKKKLIIGFIIGLIILTLAGVTGYAKYRFDKAVKQEQNQNTSEISVECPDTVEYDATTGLPIWVRGETRKQITSDEDVWITKNCQLASVAEATSTESVAAQPTEATTNDDAAKSTDDNQVTNTPSPASTPSSADPPSDTLAPAASIPPDSNPTEPDPVPPAPVEEETADPLVIKNLGVNFAPYNAETDRAGDFAFMYNDRPFLEFGENGTEPTFTYIVVEGVDIFAVADGYVRAVTYQPSSSDYSIIVSTHPELHTWEIDYDHLTSPMVSVGQRITAGKVIGKPATGVGGFGNGWFEIQVFGGTNAQGKLINHCPFNFFSPSLIATYKQKLTTLMEDFNDFFNLSDPYNFSDYSATGHVGCLVSTMAEE